MIIFRGRTAALLLAALLVLVGCGGADSAEEPGDRAEATVAATDEPGAATEMGTEAATEAETEAETADAGEPLSVTIGYANAAGNFLPIFVAQQEEIFPQHGLEAELFQAQTRESALLLSGDAQFGVGGALGIVQAVSEGADLVLIGGIQNGLSSVAYSVEDVETVPDLEGRTLALSSAGGAVDLGGRLMLEEFGLEGDVDVEIVYIGDIRGRISALESGQVDAAVGPLSPSLEEQGFNLLYNLGELKYAQSAISTTREFAEQNPDAIEGFRESMAEAIAWIRDDANREQALQYYSEFTGVTDEIELEAQLDHYLNVWVDDVTIDPESLQSAIDYATETGSAPVEQEQLLIDGAT